jgi:hypothetical protein
VPGTWLPRSPPPPPAVPACLQMRKMMSLIIEDMQPTGEHPAFFLFSKGADSTLMSKLAPPSVHGTAERARARAEVVRLTDSQLRFVVGCGQDVL